MKTIKQTFKATPYRSGNSRVVTVPDYLFKAELLKDNKEYMFTVED